MFDLLSLPHFILLGILLKLRPQAFSRLFRSNKAIRQLIEGEKAKFAIRAKGHISYVYDTFISWSPNWGIFRNDCYCYLKKTMISKRLKYLVAIKPKHATEKYIPSVFLDTYCYFKFEHLKMNFDLAKVYRIRATTVETFWHSLTSSLAVMRPDNLIIRKYTEEENYEKKHELIQLLNLKTLTFDEPDGMELAPTLLEFTQFVKKMSIQRPTNGSEFETSIQAIVEGIIRDNGYGQLEHLSVMHQSPSLLNFVGAIPNIQLHHDCERSTTKLGNLKILTVPLEQGIILVAEHESVKDNLLHQLHILLARDYAAFKKWQMKEFDGKLHIERIWRAATNWKPKTTEEQ